VIDNVAAAGAPAQSGGAGAGMMAKLGGDEFLKLFVTKLRNQDPLNPLSDEQMLSQLAQFTSVEQLTQIGNKLDAQQDLLAAFSGQTAVGMLGRTVRAHGDQVVVPAEGAAEVSFRVGGSGGIATLRVLDSAGTVVGERELGAVGAGQQTAPLGAAGAGLPPGVYRYEVQVVDAEGRAVAVETYSGGRVDGVRHGPSGPVLVADGAEIPLIAVIEVLG
jgi:flagellar basal-body rod modification protein FlgD